MLNWLFFQRTWIRYAWSLFLTLFSGLFLFSSTLSFYLWTVDVNTRGCKIADEFLLQSHIWRRQKIWWIGISHLSVACFSMLVTCFYTSLFSLFNLAMFRFKARRGWRNSRKARSSMNFQYHIKDSLPLMMFRFNFSREFSILSEFREENVDIFQEVTARSKFTSRLFVGLSIYYFKELNHL